MKKLIDYFTPTNEYTATKNIQELSIIGKQIKANDYYMKHLIEKHEACIATINLILEGQRTLDEMLWSNGRNEEQGLTPYHTEENIQAEIRAIERLQERYTLLTAKL